MVAAASKLRSRQELENFLTALGVGNSTARTVGVGVVFGETVLGVNLITPNPYSPLVAGAAGAAVVFVVVQSLALRISSVTCGCFGFDRAGHHRLVLLRAVVLALAASVGAVAAHVSETGSGPHRLVGFVTGCAALAATALAQEIAFFEKHRMPPVLTVTRG